MSSQKKPSMGGVGASYDDPNFGRGGYGATPSYDNDKRPFNYEDGGAGGYNLNRQTGNGGGGMGGRPPSGRRAPGGQPVDNYNN